MSDPKDQINFQGGASLIPDAGIYGTPHKTRSSHSEELPQTSSRILNAPASQTAYASFGLDGIKSILLQELVQLDWPQLQDELSYLAEGANQHKDIKRALRATKLLASQWLEDPRQPEEIQQKCEFIFSSISTFGTLQVQPTATTASQQGAFAVQFPQMGPLEPVGAEVEHDLSAGSGVLLITDLQGHYERLENMLVNTQMAQVQEGALHWTAPPDLYLMVIGDLFNKSPYSTWGDAIGKDSYRVFRTLERFMKIAPERVLIAYGAHDLDLAIGAAFYHPVSGFMGETLGVNAQAQAIPAIRSFILGTSQPEQADFAWQYLPDVDAFTLSEPYLLQGFPYLLLPAREGAPDLTPLLQFYDALFQHLTAARPEQRPQTIQQIDALAAGLLPASTEQLNLQNLATSLGRCLHFQGLLAGSGALDFLRHQVAGLHILKMGALELFAMHPEIQEITLDMLLELKPREDEAWHPPDLETFVRSSRVLIQRRINPERMLVLLRQARINQLNEWLALSEQHFYRRLLQSQQLKFWVPEVIAKRDEKGFVEAYRTLRWELINEDRTGLVGYAINMDGVGRRGEPLMRKMADLDERTRRSYAKTFLMDLFREELPVAMNVQPEGIVIEYPNAQEPNLVISLLIDDSVAIYRDPKDNLHMPVKHAAWLEYRS